MRKLFTILLPLLFAGCVNSNEQNDVPQVGEQIPEHITAMFEQPSSRTMVLEEKYICWTDGDEISYFPHENTNLQYRLQSIEGEQGEQGQFVRITTPNSSGEKLKSSYAIYPYAENSHVEGDNLINVELPATQYYAEMSFGVGATTMVAVSESNSATLRFQSVVGYLKLQLYGNDLVVKRIEFQGNNGEKISGEASINLTVGSGVEVKMGGSASSIVTLDCREGVRVSNDREKPTAFWFALPPQLFENGFLVTIYDDKGTAYVKSTSKPYSIDRNMIQPMKALDVRKDTVLDIEDINGKVQFFLAERADGVRALTGVERDWRSSKVLMNGEQYAITLDSNGAPYILTDYVETGVYEAVLLASQSKQWYGNTPYRGVVLPCSQFEDTSSATISSFPMYATYKKANGRTLVFDDGFAVLHVRLRGKADIVSVRVEAEGRYDLSGRVAAVPATGEYSVEKGVNFVALNCTNRGTYVPLSPSKYHDFYLMIAPGDYSQGLRLSVCDKEYKAMFFNLKDVHLSAGDTYTLTADYKPDEDLVFYEGFDNCVWGGDIVRGKEGTGFAPDAATIGITSALQRTGYEQALTVVPYNNPGSAYVQSNTWDDVSAYTVATSHQVSDSYITSRHFDDYKYIFRTQECPGYVAIGAPSTTRGIYHTPTLRGMKEIGSYRAKMCFALQAGYGGDLEVRVVCGGRITKAVLDGKEIELTAENSLYTVKTATLYIDKARLSVASSAANAKVWHTLEIDAENVIDGTTIDIRDRYTDKRVHGIYLDYLEVRKIDTWKRKPNTLRVILWNIQNGMWADQHNNYDNFVEWVKRWDADVCVWCESETIYKDKTNTATSSKYLPDGWGKLCKRYGHTYFAVGGNRDNYPQTVTSKYPIEVVQRITNTNVSGKPIAHGAGHFTITVNGKKINIVTLHMWPQAYRYGAPSAEQEDSKAKNEGDLYREFEMQYIVDQTVNNSKYKNEEYWLVGGDTNAVARIDNWHYGYDTSSTKFLVHDLIASKTDLKDVIVSRYPGCFMATTASGRRIDIMYASPAMYNMMVNSMTLIDAWVASTVVSPYYSGFKDPSDHYPLIMDFDLSK